MCWMVVMDRKNWSWLYTGSELCKMVCFNCCSKWGVYVLGGKVFVGVDMVIKVIH